MTDLAKLLHSQSVFYNKLFYKGVDDSTDYCRLVLSYVPNSASSLLH